MVITCPHALGVAVPLVVAVSTALAATNGLLIRNRAAVDAHSEHPIAKAIVSAAKEHLPMEGFKAIPGKGAEGRVNGKEVKVVSPG
jgi:Cu2+-exporting ATPase